MEKFYSDMVTELAKSYNFSENAFVLGTAIHDETAGMYDVSIHFGTQDFYPTLYIVGGILRNFLKPLDDEYSAETRAYFQNIINNDEEERK